MSTRSLLQRGLSVQTFGMVGLAGGVLIFQLRVTPCEINRFDNNKHECWFKADTRCCFLLVLSQSFVSSQVSGLTLISLHRSSFKKRFA